jgi:hypothetical protein
MLLHSKDCYVNTPQYYVYTQIASLVIYILKINNENQTDPARILTYSLITPWSRVLLEALTGSQPVKICPAFYGTRMFITAFTSARQLSLSSASSIQFIPPHPNFWRSILILSFHLRLWVSLIMLNNINIINPKSGILLTQIIVKIGWVQNRCVGLLCYAHCTNTW